MQFLILLAIGMVLVTDRMESPLIFMPGWSGAVAVITSVLALAMILVRSARQKIFAAMETGHLPIALVQRTYLRAQHGLRLLSVGGQFLLIFGTSWPWLIRGLAGEHAAGLDELILLIPFVLWLMVGYYFLYPVDRAIRESMLEAMLHSSQPVHPVWTRQQYLAFQMRFQLLLVGLPLMLIIVAKDLIDLFRAPMVEVSRDYLGLVRLRPFAGLVPEGMLMGAAGLIFLLAPFLIKWVWRAKSLPPGELRDGLARLAAEAKLRLRDILLWPTYGVIVNAAVVGFVGPTRYILLSDGLIESLTDGQIEAVFGHEIGHVRLHHLPFFLAFAFASMGLIGLGGWEIQTRFHLSEPVTQGLLLAGMVAVWFFAFGFISRRFEAQADLYGAKLLSREFDRRGCRDPECLRHTVGRKAAGEMEPLCLAGAELFASALDRTASLNAVPRSANSWRHGSIERRCHFVIQSARRLSSLTAFQVRIGWIKGLLVLAAVTVIAWTVFTVWRIATDTPP